MTAESAMWLIGPFALAFLASLVARRRRIAWLWGVVIPPYALLGYVYTARAYAAVAEGFRFIDGIPSALAWNAGGAAIFLGTMAHIGARRGWRLLSATILSGIAGVIPVVFGMMGGGILLGVVGAVIAIVTHAAQPIPLRNPASPRSNVRCS